MAYPATGSKLDNNGTNVSLSTFILIKVNGRPVGAVKSLQINEGRNITSIAEIGTDGIVDSAPSKAATVDGSCTRTRFDRMRITEAFDQGFLHVKSQRYPFDIEIIDRISGDPASYISTVIHKVWIKTINYNLDSDNYIIVDTMTWQGEDISSKIGNKSAATGGKIGQLTSRPDDISIQADTGQRRGGLDLPDLYEY